MKEIRKEDIEMLERKNVIHNTSNGYVNKFGKNVGFYKTKNKRYIEDKYVDIAKKLVNGETIWQKRN